MVSSIQRGLFVTGTDTGDGKTHIAAILAHRKRPVQPLPVRKFLTDNRKRQ